MDVQDDYNGETALMYAARNGHTEVVATLLESGARVDIESSNGETASNLADEKGHEDIVALLRQN